MERGERGFPVCFHSVISALRFPSVIAAHSIHVTATALPARGHGDSEEAGRSGVGARNKHWSLHVPGCRLWSSQHLSCLRPNLPSADLLSIWGVTHASKPPVFSPRFQTECHPVLGEPLCPRQIWT